MAYQLGSQMAVKWATKLLLGKLSAGFSGSLGSVDTTNDSSNGFKESLPTDLSGSVSFSGVYDPLSATGQGIEDLKADWLAKTTRPLIFGGIVTADKTTTATAYISKFALSAKHGDKITADVTFEFTGSFASTVAP